ncbi:MAG: glycosyltransferase [Planctomycetia bacterium]|nr:glycosyltransferase [Planctomycetia bacterium]
MLEKVHVGAASIDAYEGSAGADAVTELRTLAAPLRGIRVLHVNATPYGGGVAEMLFSEIPLLRDLGLAADWRIIRGDVEFFNVTKRMHNGLQGARRDLTTDEQNVYLENSKRIARLFDEDYDLVVVHDPQPLALLHLHGKGKARWIWRCHIDTSQPNDQVWNFLKPFLSGYDAAVFTLDSFEPPDLPVPHVEAIPPAIDPESPKNIDLDPNLARRLLRWVGVELDRPLVTQISRFDPWKDPLGVIAAFRLVQRQFPEVQLALVGSMALDDPEAWEMYRQIQDASRATPGIQVFTNLTGVGNVEVNAFQRLSNVVIQKSLREGFGLVVAETLWKGTPVVAGRAGGIPLQLQDDVGGFLVESVEACAERTAWLLEHPQEARAIGERGRDIVHQRFLLPRLIADDLRLYRTLLKP